MQNFITKRKLKKLIPVIILLILCVVLINYYYKNNKTTEVLAPEKILDQNIKEIEQQNYLATLEINGIKYETEISATEKINVYDFMNKLRAESKIDFKEKIYTSMGAFIEEINNIKNSGEKNWIYYVNNQKANIGISNYQIKPGDVVSWKYEKAL
ncbi:MAG: DUF4430 domain-containing protein [Patescibacteria group bacterium]